MKRQGHAIARERGQGNASVSGQDGITVSHPGAKSRDARNEIARLFGLTELLSIPANLWNPEHSVKRVEELGAKAAKLSF